MKKGQNKQNFIYTDKQIQHPTTLADIHSITVHNDWMLFKMISVPKKQ